MKKTLLYIYLLLFSGLLAFAQESHFVDSNFYSSYSPTSLTGSNGVIYSMHNLPDGKVLIGGNFSAYNERGYDRGLTRLNPDGSKDVYFSSGGRQLYGVLAIAVQSNNKIIIGGQFIHYDDTFDSHKHLLRLTSNGALDNTFNIGSGFNDDVTKVIVLPNDKILVFGKFTTYQGITANRIVLLNSDGSRDTSFDAGTGANQSVFDAEIQPDGKIIIGGEFTTYNGTNAERLARINTNGAIDTSFNVGNGFRQTQYTGTVNDITLQADGKILAAGIFTSFNGIQKNGLARVNSDGSIDAGFDFNSSGYQGSDASRTALFSDGKILVTGFKIGGDNAKILKLHNDGSIDNTYKNLATNNATEIALLLPSGKFLLGGGFNKIDEFDAQGIVRLNTDGSKDATFNVGLGFNAAVHTTALQTDGKLLVGGVFDNYNRNIVQRMTRLDDEGNIDPDFNIGSGFNHPVKKIIIQPDGKILVSGNFTSFNGTSVRKLVRLNPDGSLDNTFTATAGYAPADDLRSLIDRLVLQPDGKILISGVFHSGQTATGILMRLNPDGSQDITFNMPVNGTTYTMAVRPDGKIIVGGNYYSGTPRLPSLMLLNPDGSPDPNFAFTHTSPVTAVALRADGKIYAGGNFYNPGDVNQGILLVNPDGSLDTTYSNNTDVRSGNIEGLTQQADGKLIATGTFAFYGNVLSGQFVRINVNGSRDTTFNTGNLGCNDRTYCVSITPEGKIFVGGEYTIYNSNTVVNRLTRVNPDGIKDDTFNTQDGFNAAVNAVSIQTDEKILVGGEFSLYYDIPISKIIRLNKSDASIDNTFNIGLGFNNSVKTIALQNNGKVLVGGNFTTYNETNAVRIIRLNTDGSVDNTFSSGTGFNGVVNEIKQQRDGKIIVGGDFSNYNGAIANRLIRLNSDGSIDAGFNIGSGFNNTVNAIAFLSDGSLLIVGSFTNFNNVAKNRFVKLNADGSINPDFNIGSGPNQRVRTIAVQRDGKILIGGDFSRFNGIESSRIARLNADGTLDTSFIVLEGFNDYVSKIVLYDNGKILAGGNFITYQNYFARKLVRINTDGSIDTTLALTYGFDNTVYTMAIQQDGGLLAGGNFRKYQNQDKPYFLRLEGDDAALLSTAAYDLRKPIVLYPNPVRDILHLSTAHPYFDFYEIYDLTGKRIAANSLSEKQIDVSYLKSGIYIVMLKLNSETFTAKFVKE